MRPRDNPFSAERLDTLAYKCQPTFFEDLLERLALFNYRAAIVGPHGSGKSALLEALAPKLRGRGFDTSLLQVTAESALRAAGVDPAFAGY